MRHFLLPISLFFISLNVWGQELFPLTTTAVVPPYDKEYQRNTQARIEGSVFINGFSFTEKDLIRINGFNILPEFSDLFQNETNNVYKISAGGIDETTAFELYDSDLAEIFFRIKPDPAHINQVADIIVTVGYIDMNTALNITLSWLLMGYDLSDIVSAASFASMFPNNELLGVKIPISYFILDSQYNILPLPERWEAKDLIPFKTITLAESQDFSLYKGNLSPAIIAVFCWYRLADGTLVFNKEPLSLIVTSSSGSDSVWDQLGGINLPLSLSPAGLLGLLSLQ
jgi:hypothetical protein